ncbi:hypothetical protein SAV14893_036090 [Streptomyces avermitilis]|uniref:Uncharacterized protein n=1 Tax=Streptomyces avermitilis TaxID=33903 RepID=A0A4D4LXI4_STRAX|nr:hypothetical protein SAV14893_036090 [Streptomyces avermitilis]GDY84601.1 hypothetical protein SAVCW2_38000 [Streptomyces avermitilis]
MTPRISQRWGWPWGTSGAGEVDMLYTVEQSLYAVQRTKAVAGALAPATASTALWEPSGDGQLPDFFVRS